VTGFTVRAPGPEGWGTTVTNAETGEEIKGIARIGIEIEPAAPIRIQADLFSTGIDVSGELALYIADPATGETKQPARIEFKDGSVWTAA
jgi:hypothetical protein